MRFARFFLSFASPIRVSSFFFVFPSHVPFFVWIHSFKQLPVLDNSGKVWLIRTRGEIVFFTHCFAMSQNQNSFCSYWRRTPFGVLLRNVSDNKNAF